MNESLDHCIQERRWYKVSILATVGTANLFMLRLFGKQYMQ